MPLNAGSSCSSSRSVASMSRRFFLLAIGPEIRHDRAHVRRGDLRRWRAQRERVARPLDAGELEQQPDLALAGAREHRRFGVEAEDARGPPEMCLENLAYVHSGRHAERIEHYINRPSIRKKGHILFWHDAGNDSFIAVASRHLVAHGDLALLR